MAPIDQLWPIEALPNYFNIVKVPMDLGTIKAKLESGHYGDNPSKFATDVRSVLPFRNAGGYVPRVRSRIFGTDVCAALFGAGWSGRTAWRTTRRARSSTLRLTG